MIEVVAFDLFGTVFDLSGVPREELKAYAAHISQSEWSPIEFPLSWRDLPVFPDAQEGIRLLRENHEVITFSNCPIDLQTHLCEKHDVKFDWHFSLAAQRVFKPNPKAYQRLQSHYCGVVKPESILVVSANERFGDIEGARQAGMQSLLIRHGRPNDILELVDYLKQMS